MSKKKKKVFIFYNLFLNVVYQARREFPENPGNYGGGAQKGRQKTKVRLTYIVKYLMNVRIRPWTIAITAGASSQCY